MNSIIKHNPFIITITQSTSILLIRKHIAAIATKTTIDATRDRSILKNAFEIFESFVGCFLKPFRAVLIAVVLMPLQ